MVAELSPIELQTWLEWAGARLIAMPGSRTRPAEPYIVWPEYSQNTSEVLNFRSALPLRASAPSSEEIPIVDEILLLPNTCSDVYKRRLLHARSLVHPISHKYLYRWTRLAEILHTSPARVKSLHSKGLTEAARKADKSRVCRIATFFRERAA